VETQLREKPLRGSQTQEFHYSEDKARYKTVTLTCTDAVVVPWSLTCNPTRTLPNQVNLPEGVFNGTPYFRANLQDRLRFAARHTWKLASEEISRLWALMEFTPNSFGSKCPRASIYRLGVRMAKYAWEPFGRWTMAVRTDNYATGFSKIFEEKSFLYKNIVRTGWLDRPDGPWGRSVRTAKLQHAISISDARASGPWGGDVWTVEVE